MPPKMKLLENRPIPESDLAQLKKLENYILEYSPERCFLANPRATFSWEIKKDTHWLSVPENIDCPLVFLKIDVKAYEEGSCGTSYVDIEFLAGEQVATYRLERFVTFWCELGITKERLSLMESRFNYVFHPFGIEQYKPTHSFRKQSPSL